MTDSMKFGPEWLRNLSGDSCNTTGSGGGSMSLTIPRYQLAEHRYGREEMLALFDPNYKPPQPLTTFPALYVEKAQPPLALIQMAEDETRLWNGGVTSAGSRGRGGSVDRGGRGRGGRGGLYSSHYSRGSFDEAGDGPRAETQPFPSRGRPFDRSQSERGWSERNGVTDPGEWNGSTSPRKEIGRPSGGSLMESNWRRRNGEDEEGWRGASSTRNEKWVRSSWRDGGGSERERLDSTEGHPEEGRSGGRWEPRGSHRSSHEPHHPPPRISRTWESNHHDNHDNLPEWATENLSESGGSFDASGAFHGGMFSDEEEDGTGGGTSQEPRNRQSLSEGSATSTSKPSSKHLHSSNSINQGQATARHTNTTTGVLSRERPKSLHPFEGKDASTERGRSVSPPKSTAPSLGDATTKEGLPEGGKTSGGGSSGRITEKKPQPSVQRSKSSVELSAKAAKANSETRPKGEPTVASSGHQPSSQSESQKLGNLATGNMRQRSEDDLDRMKEEADALVAKLMADEEGHRGKTAGASTVGNQVPQMAATSGQEKWFYQDPQGEVQGPFLASEMAEWCKAGYFTAGLMVKRTCDEGYTMLGDLTKMCGRIPFTPGPVIPPLKMAKQVIPPVPTVPSTVPAGLPGAALSKTGMEDPLLLLQYQQLQLLQSLQNQQMLLRQRRSAVIAKLSQSEHWATLNPTEQNELILQHVFQTNDEPDLHVPANPFVPPIASQAPNPVMQLFTQMQRAPTENHLPPSLHSAATTSMQQLIQQMGGLQNLPSVQQPSVTTATTPAPEEDPIKSLLRQLNVNVNGHPNTQMESVWPQTAPQVTPQFSAQNWLAQVGPIPAMPPGQIPSSLWDLYTKEMKTEQQILEEQNIRLQEDRKKEELRKQDELKRQAEEENLRKKEEERVKQAEETKRKEEEKKRKEEDKRRKEEEKRKQEDEQRKKDEKKRKEEERKRDEKRKLEEETNRKKQEEEKRKREEAKKLEEKQKKEEEKRRKLEEEQKKLEEEKIKKEEEARIKAEAEDQAKRTEQRRREAEALRKLQERSKAPWAQAPHAPPPAAHASLAEIQRLEREKKAEELRLQQITQQQLAQQKAAEAAQEASATDSSKRLQFKWAEKAIPSGKAPQVKSLAQIQQEEQERLAKVKQQERERQEKSGQKEAAAALQNAGIWGTASQSLTWATSSGTNNHPWANSYGAGGFWDDPTVAKSTTNAKQPGKPTPATKISQNPPQQQQQQQQQHQNNKVSKSRNKREEELVKKLFEQNTARPDDFTQWCTKALSGIQTSLDIPTFIVFLRDIEPAYEVKEYVRMYLGDGVQSMEFAKQFLEKRSKWRSSQRPQAQADDLCKPAPAVNPNAPAEFQEVKSKSKKPKKGKMFKVDSRILGFSVTSAPDRINVGDRDYGEGI